MKTSVFKKLPFNLLISIPSGISVYFFIHYGLEIEIIKSIPIAILYWFEISLFDAKIDALEERMSSSSK